MKKEINTKCTEEETKIPEMFLKLPFFAYAGQHGNHMKDEVI
jgi:hypothetical protein